MSDKNVNVNMGDSAGPEMLGAMGCLGCGGLLAIIALVCLVGGAITGYGAYDFAFSLILGW